MESHIELETSFRFLDLSKEQADELKSSGLACEFGEHFKTKAITGIVPLESTAISQIAEFIGRKNIPVAATDIFVSFTTEYDTRIIDIPNYVNEAIAKLGSKMVLSYTVL